MSTRLLGALTFATAALVAVSTAQAQETRCEAVTLDRTALYVGSGEANWIIYVTAPSATCTWTAASDADWLIVKSSNPSPPFGNGYVKVRAIANLKPKRVGHFLVGGVVFTVTQG